MAGARALQQHMVALSIQCYLVLIGYAQPGAHAETCISMESDSVTGSALFQKQQSKALMAQTFAIEEADEGASAGTEDQGGIGSTASLDETGFDAVYATCCMLEMDTFIRRIIQDSNYELCHESGLLGLVPWYSCDPAGGNKSTKQTYKKLVVNLQGSVPPVPCAFIAPPGKCQELAAVCTGVFVPNSHRRRTCAQKTLAPTPVPTPAPTTTTAQKTLAPTPAPTPAPTTTTATPTTTLAPTTTTTTTTTTPVPTTSAATTTTTTAKGPFLLIADTNNNRVLAWYENSTEGILVGGGTFGKELDQLNKPQGVAYDVENEYIYVSDSKNNRILRYTWESTEGELVAGTGSTSMAGVSAPLTELRYPTKIEYIDGELLICDSDNNRILRWVPGESEGRLVAGPSDDNSMKLTDPYHAVLDSQDNVIVADYNNHRLMKYDASDRTPKVLAGGNGYMGQMAKAPFNEMAYPAAVRLRSNGQYLVAESQSSRITVWSAGGSEGKILAGAEGFAGFGTNMLNNPHDVIEHKGHLVIADKNNHRIVKWKIGDSSGYIDFMAGKQDPNSYMGLGPDKGSGLDQLDGPSAIAYIVP